MIKEILLQIKNRFISDRIKVDIDIELPKELIGNNEMDSTYVYMDMFDGSENRDYIIYSAGIGDQINFELDLLKRLENLGIKANLYAIDPTPKALEFLSTQRLPENFHILKYALSNKNQMLSFSLPQEKGWVSGSAVDVKDDSRRFDFENKISVQGKTIKSIMDELGHSHIDLLKMDIEGSEFDVLEKAFSDNISITQMCIDHHEYMLRKNGKKRMRELLDSLKNQYLIYYSNNRNCSLSCIKNGSIKH